MMWAGKKGSQKPETLRSTHWGAGIEWNGARRVAGTSGIGKGGGWAECRRKGKGMSRGDSASRWQGREWLRVRIGVQRCPGEEDKEPGDTRGTASTVTGLVMETDEEVMVKNKGK